MYTGFIIAFVVTSFGLWVLRPVAVSIGLVDKPGGHKTHNGEIPLIGGIAMYLGLVVPLVVYQPFPHWGTYIFASGLLLITGAADDYRELRVSTRMLMQLLAGLVMAQGAQNVLWSLGDIGGLGVVELGFLAVPFTLLCVVGVINALNMSDGMDGMAGSLALITVVLVMVLVWLQGSQEKLGLLLLFPAVLIPFLVVNLCSSWRKCGRAFMGDAGSTVLGFSLAWILIAYSQGEDAVFRPVTALWLIAVPLIDTVSIMIRRMLKGRSPFMPDRQHFHHVLLAAGLTSQQTLLVVVAVSVLMGGIGIAGEIALVPEWQMVAGFVMFGLLYLVAVQHAWRVKRALSQFIT